MDAEVVYRDIPGWPGYRAGSDGSVWSCRTKGGGTGPWHRLSPGCSRLRTKGYGRRHGTVRQTQVVLYRGDGLRSRKSILVGRLVLEAFVGPCPTGMECCHNDGDATNNRPENLRWDTRRENMADMVRHGRGWHPTGNLRWKGKLKEEEVLRVFALKEEGWSMARIGRELNVSPSTIGFILQGITWSELTKDVRKEGEKC